MAQTGGDCSFCERNAVAVVKLAGISGDVPVCERHFIILSESATKAEKEKKAKDKPREFKDEVGGRPTPRVEVGEKVTDKTGYVRFKLPPAMHTHLRRHFGEDIPNGIRKLIKAHMAGTKPIDDPVAEKAHWLLVDAFSHTDGVIPDIEDISSAVMRGLRLSNEHAGVVINTLLKEQYLWRQRDGSWKIGVEKRSFSITDSFADLFG